MDAAQSILEMMSEFMKPEFDRSAAESMLGPVIQGEDPGTLTIEPRASFLERITLETAETELGLTVIMVFMQYKAPVDVDLGTLKDHFGPYRELPRLKPDQSTPIMFDVPSDVFDGGLLLEVDGSGDGEIRQTSAIRLDRLPLEKQEEE